MITFGSARLLARHVCSEKRKVLTDKGASVGLPFLASARILWCPYGPGCALFCFGRRRTYMHPSLSNSIFFLLFIRDGRRPGPRAARRPRAERQGSAALLSREQALAAWHGPLALGGENRNRHLSQHTDRCQCGCGDRTRTEKFSRLQTTVLLPCTLPRTFRPDERLSHTAHGILLHLSRARPAGPHGAHLRARPSAAPIPLALFPALDALHACVPF